MQLSLSFNLLLHIVLGVQTVEIAESTESFLDPQSRQPGGSVLKPAFTHHFGKHFQRLK